MIFRHHILFSCIHNMALNVFISILIKVTIIAISHVIYPLYQICISLSDIACSTFIRRLAITAITSSTQDNVIMKPRAVKITGFNDKCSHGEQRALSVNTALSLFFLPQPIGRQHLANGGGPREARAAHGCRTLPQHRLPLYCPSSQLLRPERSQPNLWACQDAGWVTSAKKKL